MTSTGERQLLALKPHQLQIIDYLLSADVYSVNEALRTGQGLNNGPGPIIDYAGYSSNREFYRDALAVFTSLGSSLNINATIQLYRGIGHVNGPHSAAATMQNLLSGIVPPKDLIDPGFGFAVPTPATAVGYTSGRPGSAAGTPVLWHLTADRGLCIPEPNHRSNQLTDEICNAEALILNTAIGQVIFPPDTKWRVTTIDLVSQFNMPVVHMKQG